MIEVNMIEVCMSSALRNKMSPQKATEYSVHLEKRAAKSLECGDDRAASLLSHGAYVWKQVAELLNNDKATRKDGISDRELLELARQRKLNTRPMGCTCNFSIVNNAHVEKTAQDAQGCPLHCQHLGIKLGVGGICNCGECVR